MPEFSTFEVSGFLGQGQVPNVYARLAISVHAGAGFGITALQDRTIPSIQIVVGVGFFSLLTIAATLFVMFSTSATATTWIILNYFF